MSREDAQKFDVLMGLKNNGWNLQETDDPATFTMSLGVLYTLIASVNKPWVILFDDGIQKTEYPIDSEKVPFTNRKDVNKLFGMFEAGFKALGVVDNPSKPVNPPAKSNSEQKKNKKGNGKNKKYMAAQELPGMMLPIVYPAEMVGSFMRFKQWAAENNVIPQNSEVVLLDEDDYNYRVSIPQAHISFDIPKDKAEIIEAVDA